MLRLFALLAGLFLFVGPALAHDLDGRWCAPDGRQIVIQGLKVITPGGQRSTGAYGPNAFSFPLPEGERHAGSIIWMELKGPNSARVSTVAPSQQGPPPHDRWHRCKLTSGLAAEPWILVDLTDGKLWADGKTSG